jgi:hypothetical protein
MGYREQKKLPCNRAIKINLLKTPVVTCFIQKRIYPGIVAITDLKAIGMTEAV